jgi:hypothetical protein
MSSQRGLIAARAYELWKLRGSPEGSPDVDWHQAEQEILGRTADPSNDGGNARSTSTRSGRRVTSGSDRGPTDSDTAEPSPDVTLSKPAKSNRKRGRSGSESGQAGTEGP